MKKIVCLVAMASLLLVGCSTTDGGTKTSQGTGSGYGGEIKVELVTEGNTIKDIKVVSNHETSVVFDRALPIITERIIEAQSPVVDSVSGATFTSFGVKKAVAEAMKEAGIGEYEISFNTQGPEVEKKDLEEVKTQVVVVGGGPAGLSAAIEAKQNGVEDVIVIEKLDILSGNGKFDLDFVDLINSEAQKANGIEDTVEDFVTYLKETKKAWDSEERLIAQAEGSYVLDEWLRDMGISLDYNFDYRNHMTAWDKYAGEHIQEKMEEKVNDLGIEVRTGTKGLDLIMEDGKATGVKVECKEGYYDIKADAVIVATGGFSSNKELLAKYAPGTETLKTSNQMGTTGDFIPVFEENNIALDKMDVTRIFPFINIPRRDLTGGPDGFILVNNEGERFIDETTREMALASAIQSQPNGEVFYIYDNDLYESNYRLQKHTGLGYHVKADTLEELAEILGINAENLKATVNTFNEAVEGKIEDPYRAEAFTDTFNENGPYYGVKVESAIHMTRGGVVANENAEVLTNDGKIVDGLYAAGEVTASSQAYSAAVVFGRISGEEAAKYILK